MQTNKLSRDKKTGALISSDSESYYENKTNKDFKNNVFLRLQKIESNQNKQNKTLSDILNIVHNISIELKN